MAADRRLRWVLGGLVLAGAAAEVVNAFFIEQPPAALGIAALFALAWFRVMQGRTDGVVLAGALFVFELVGLPIANRDETADWIIQLFLAAVALVGLVAVVVALRGLKPT